MTQGSRAIIEPFFGMAAGGNDAPRLTVYPVFDMGTQDKTAKTAGAVISLIPQDQKIFSAKRGQTHYVESHGTRYMLLGLGAPDTLDETASAQCGAALQAALRTTSARDIAVYPLRQKKGQGPRTKINEESFAAHIASGAVLKSYEFNHYKTNTGKKNPAGDIYRLYFHGVDQGRAEVAYVPLRAVAAGVYLARDLANEPPNTAFPLAVANRAEAELGDAGVKVTVFTTRDLIEMKAGGLLAVGQGSKQPPCMVVMEYDGTAGTSKRPDLALVGKGVTFDTGGISIKPSANMQDMKYDMSGAADVIGTMLAISRRKARTHVIGIVGLAENMPDGNAYRPGDVIHLMSGKSVEITNTDAEGRLVLSDCLTYVEREYKPKAIIDLATLTGACVAALGHTYAAVLTRDEKLEKRIIKAGCAVGELCHPMPMHDAFTRAVKGSKIADLMNSVPGPGISIAGAFLEQALSRKTPWAHMDIAGMAYGVSGGLYPESGTASGFGVRLLDHLIRFHYEQAVPTAGAMTVSRKSPNPA